MLNTASVRLVNYNRGVDITKTTDEEDGFATFVNIIEDSYELYVTAPQHQSIKHIIGKFAQSSHSLMFILLISIFQYQPLRYTGHFWREKQLNTALMLDQLLLTIPMISPLKPILKPMSQCQL